MRRAVAVLLGAAVLITGGATEAVAAPPQSAAPVRTAEAMTWSPVTTHGGGWVTGLATSRTGQVYARTDVGGAYRWDDGRGSWDQMLTSAGVPGADPSDYGVESLAASDRDGRVLYAAVGEGMPSSRGRVLRSADGGRSWRDGGARFKISGNGDWRWAGERLSVDPADPDVVMFGTRAQGAHRSVDGGRTWTRLAVPAGPAAGAAPAGVMFTLFDPRSPVVAGRTQGAWVGVQDVGVLRTDDAGRSWRLVHRITDGVPRDVELSSSGSLFVVVDGRKDQVLRIDTRTGRTTDISPAPGGAYAVVAVDPRDPARVFVGEVGVRDGKLWRSRDGGGAWQAVDVALAAGSQDSWVLGSDIERWMSAGALAFDPVRPGVLWFAEGMGMWRSTDLADGELTWRFTSAGIEELVSNAGIKPPGRPLVTASWDRGLFRHPDPARGGATLPYRTSFGSAWDLAASPTDADFLVAVLDDHQDLTGKRSPDRRASGYSTDGGATWTRFPALARGTAPADLMFGNIAVSAKDNDNLVWAPSNSWTAKVYFSRDRGGSWRPGTLVGAVPGDYLHPAHYLKRRILAADPGTAGTFYALGGNDRSGASTLWQSVDGGATWRRTSPGGPGRPGYWDFRFNSHLVAVPGRPGHLFALPGATDDGSRPYWRSVDGGRTWSERSDVRDAHDIGVGAPVVPGGDPTLFTYGKVQGRRGVYRSTDLGTTWTFLTDHPRGWYQGVAAVVGDPEVPGKVYLGFVGGGFVVGTPAGAAVPAPPSGVRRPTGPPPASPSPGSRLSAPGSRPVGVTARRASVVTLRTTMAPARPGAPVALQVRLRTGWRTVATATVDRGGVAAFRYLTTRVPTTTTLRFSMTASASPAAATSASFILRTT